MTIENGMGFVNNFDEDVIIEESEEDDAKEAVVEPVKHPDAVIEAVLFSMGNSVEVKKLAELVGRSVDETMEIIHSMQKAYNKNAGRGLTIVELEDSVQMCSKPDMYEHLVKIAKTPKSYSLSETLLETLSIVAYKQPVTRIEIEKIRGVSCVHSVNKLIEYGLITELGRLDAPGKPLLFGTTEEFLRSFGVKSLDELPVIAPDRLEEFKREASEEAQLELNI